MPTYDYICTRCARKVELFHPMNQRITRCEHCDADTLERQIGSGSGVHFKGTGFYETDYKKSKTPVAAKN